jgi:hypothetical protein
VYIPGGGTGADDKAAEASPNQAARDAGAGAPQSKPAGGVKAVKVEVWGQGNASSRVGEAAAMQVTGLPKVTRSSSPRKGAEGHAREGSVRVVDRERVGRPRVRSDKSRARSSLSPTFRPSGVSTKMTRPKHGGDYGAPSQFSGRASAMGFDVLHSQSELFEKVRYASSERDNQHHHLHHGRSSELGFNAVHGLASQSLDHKGGDRSLVDDFREEGGHDGVIVRRTLSQDSTPMDHYDLGAFVVPAFGRKRGWGGHAAARRGEGGEKGGIKRGLVWQREGEAPKATYMHRSEESKKGGVKLPMLVTANHIGASPGKESSPIRVPAATMRRSIE